ncbi:right-handed parallel beta-helix repeat-containing protein [Mucilaginibacter terrae]|uniref:right-handed parallel beta-helix repeat-containing protein n=1 Tax=Mucilaginibacter terrae TaxID=1955052 RepID=UPI00362DF40B
MKKGVKCNLLLIAIILFCNQAYAVSYYFSSTLGNDDYTSLQARNPATPWKSLEKLNTFFRNINTGDSILFKRGDVFYGSINVTKSGAVFAPIHFGAYGTGKKPEINGLATLKKWKLVGNGIYESNCETTGNTLILNGVQQALGRYPNKGYLSFESHSGNNSITDNQLNEAINWGSGEVVIKKTRWIIDRNSIVSHKGGTITYRAGNTTYVPTNGYGYFIQNNVKTLDQFGEWYLDSVHHSMMVYFGNKNPNNFVVNTSAVNYIVDVRRYNYLTFDGLTFTGAGNNAFNIVQSKKISIINCSINLTGTEAIIASYSPFLTVKDCIIDHSLSGGINMDAGCVNATIANNTIKNTGLLPGMGKSNSGTYEAITSFGDNTKIEKNRIDSVGYNGIYFGGNTSTAKNNFITYFCLTKDDGAGIYIGDWSKTVNKKVIGNIVLHGVGNSEGTLHTNSMQAEGIYIDDNTESVIITNNTVSLCANNGIKIHNAKDIDIFNNTIVDNGVQLRMEQDHYIATSSYIRNNNVRNNTFFAKTDTQQTAKFSTHQDDIKAFGQIDSNFYSSPKNLVTAIKSSSVKNGKTVNSSYTLVNWKANSGKDRFSSELPTEDILFEYNASNEVKTITLKKKYTDVYKKSYNNKVTLDPYCSIILVANKTLTLASN